MAGILWANGDFGLLAFLILGVLGGAAAFLTGRALARSWSPYWRIVPAAARACRRRALPPLRAVRGGPAVAPLLPRHYGAALLAAWLGYPRMRAQQMATQYSWVFERVGLTWRAR